MSLLNTDSNLPNQDLPLDEEGFVVSRSWINEISPWWWEEVYRQSIADTVKWYDFGLHPSTIAAKEKELQLQEAREKAYKESLWWKLEEDKRKKSYSWLVVLTAQDVSQIIIGERFKGFLSQ